MRPLLLCALIACTTPPITDPGVSLDAGSGSDGAPAAAMRPAAPLPPLVDAGAPVVPAICSAAHLPLGVCEGKMCWELPGPTGRQLHTSWAIASDEVWFGGDQTLLHWDGQRWQWYADSTSVVAVWGSGPNDAWAADADGVLHWDGRAWAIVFPHANVRHISGSGPSDLWAAADDALWHFDGSSWNTVTTPFSAVVVLVLGLNDVWIAAGPQTAHWDGSNWTVEMTNLTDENDYASSLPDVPDTIYSFTPSIGFISGGSWGLCVADAVSGLSCRVNGIWSGGLGGGNYNESNGWTPTSEALYAPDPANVVLAVNVRGTTDMGDPPTNSDAPCYTSTITGIGDAELWTVGKPGCLRHDVDKMPAKPASTGPESTKSVWDDGCGHIWAVSGTYMGADDAAAYVISILRRDLDGWSLDHESAHPWWDDSLPTIVAGAPGAEPWAAGPSGYLKRRMSGTWTSIPLATMDNL